MFRSNCLIVYTFKDLLNLLRQNNGFSLPKKEDFLLKLRSHSSLISAHIFISLIADCFSHMLVILDVCNGYFDNIILSLNNVYFGN